MCAWEQKNYEMNKCLSLVHLTAEFLSGETSEPSIVGLQQQSKVR